jgi:hypothetical protein
VRKTAREKELRGWSIVPVAIGEPITSEVLQRIQAGREASGRGEGFKIEGGKVSPILGA